MVIDYYRKRNIDVPSWEEFSQGKFINCDELDEEPFTGLDDQIKDGKPFQNAIGEDRILFQAMSRTKPTGARVNTTTTAAA